MSGPFAWCGANNVADLWRLLGRREAAQAVFDAVLALAERHARLCERGLLAMARAHLQALQRRPSGLPAPLLPRWHAAHASVLALEGADARLVDAAWSDGLHQARRRGSGLMELRLALGQWRWRCTVPRGADAGDGADPALADLARARAALTDPGDFEDWRTATSLLAAAGGPEVARC